MNSEQFKGHTSGPWAWQLFGDTYSLTAQHGRREQIINAIKHKEMGYPVVAMNQGGRLMDIDPALPNAKLIAAAPVILAQRDRLADMLERVLAVEGHGETCYGLKEWSDTMGAARALLVEVKGGTP